MLTVDIEITVVRVDRREFYANQLAVTSFHYEMTPIDMIVILSRLS